jgi:hypothetical protein
VSWVWQPLPLGGEQSSGAGATQLVIQDGTHAHTADNLALVQHSVLAVQDAASAHTADGLALVQHSVLVVQDAACAHSAENLVLTAHEPGVQLVVQDASHAHSAESLSFDGGPAPSAPFPLGLFIARAMTRVEEDELEVYAELQLLDVI